MKKAKIKIESHGVSPWHDYLQNMSWGFSRGGTKDENSIAYLNVDEKLEDGGRGLKYVLMADFLNTLSFMPVTFLNNILKKSSSAANVAPFVNDNAEVHGNTGYYYLPYEDESKGLRLDEPDGWIADGENLFLLEARGFRSPGVFNPGQLAKQYIIAKDVAEHTGYKNFYIVLIAEDFKNIYKSGKNKFSLLSDSAADFSELWQANVNDLDAASGEILSEKMKLKDWKDFFASEKIENHFLWITWNDIREIAASAKDDLKAQQIVTAVDFHSGVSKVMPVFSQLLFSLAARQEPLYRFYNGGCGSKSVMKYEEKFLKEIGESTSVRAKYWSAWHDLANHHKDFLENLAALEDARRKAVADGDEGADTLKDIQKQIKDFYRKCVDGITPRNTTRKAFELAGDSSQLEDFSEFFIQRSKVEKIEPQQQKNSSELPDHSGETPLEEKFDFVQAKLNKLLEDTVLGEYAVSIKLEKSSGGDCGCYIESEIELVFGENERKKCKFVRKKPISVDEFSMDEFMNEFSEKLQRELSADEYLYENPNIIDTDVWAKNWSKCLEKILIRIELLKYGYEICWDIDEYREEHSEYFDTEEQFWDFDDEENDDDGGDSENDEDLDVLKDKLIELIKEQEPALQKLETIETENELELKSMIGKLPDNWEEMSPEEKLATVYRKFDLLSDDDMYGLTLHGGFDWNEVFEVWLALEANEDHQFTEMGACIALTEPCAEDEFDFNKFPEYLHPIIKAKCDDDYNILCTQSDSGTCAEAAESMYFMLDLLAYGYKLTEREWFYKKHPDLYPDYDDEDDEDDEDF